jgi:hypothetical protein
LEAGKSPIEYLDILAQDSQYVNERGLSPEEEWTLFLTYLEETNQVINDINGNGKFSLNLGGYLKDIGYVTLAYWYRKGKQALAVYCPPGSSDSDTGTRTRVGI